MSILTIVMCLSITIGATFALFTSKSEVNIAVNAAKVNVTATIDEKSVATKKLYDTDYTAGYDNMFEGVATFSKGALKLERLVPGDGIKFNIVIENTSDVTVKYRTSIKNAATSDESLYSALDIKVNGYKFNGIVTTPWTKLAGVQEATKVVEIPVCIEFPDNVDGAEYMSKTVELNFLVEAIQGNAETENEIVITKDVEVSNGTVSVDNAIDTDVAKAEISAGTKLNAGETTATLTVTDANDQAYTGIQAFVNPDKVTSLIINIPEVAKDNQEVIVITLKEVATKNLSASDIKMYHTGVPMASVASVDAIVEDTFFYDASTGDITIGVTNFSNFTIVEGGELQDNVISNLDGFKYFRDLVNSGKTFAGEIVTLTTDIDLKNQNWTPIGHDGDVQGFKGTFDGQDHTIYNLKVNNWNRAYQSAGLFGSANGTIKNLTIDGADIYNLDVISDSSNGAAVLLGSSQFGSTIDNVTIKNASVAGNRRVAAIAGYFAGTITNCTVESVDLSARFDYAANSYDNGDKAGSIIAYANGAVTIENCSATTMFIEGYRDMGGIAGCLNSSCVVTNNSVEDIMFLVDSSCNYKGYTTYTQHNVGAIAGRGFTADATNYVGKVIIYSDYGTIVNNAEDLNNMLNQDQDVLVQGTINADGTFVPSGFTSSSTVEFFIKTNVSGGDFILDEEAKYGLYVRPVRSSGAVVSNMIVTTNSQWSVLLDSQFSAVALENVEIVAEKGAGVYGYGNKTITLNDVKVNHKALDPSYVSSTPWAATAVAASGKVNMVINSGTYVGTQWAVYSYNSGSTITINGGTFKAERVVQVDGIWSTTAPAVVTINDGNFDGAFHLDWGTTPPEVYINGGNFTNFSATVYGQAKLVISGGTFDVDPTSFANVKLAPGYAVTEKDGVYTVGIKVYSFAEFDEIVRNAQNGEFIGNGEIVVLKDSEKEYEGNNLSRQYFLGGQSVNIMETISNVTIKNVNFVFEDDDLSNKYVSGEIQVFTETMTFENCTFKNVSVSPWGVANNDIPTSAVFTNCKFIEVNSRYGIHQNRAENLTVEGCEFINCQRGIHTNSNAVKSVVIKNNTFTGIGEGYGAICLAEGMTAAITNETVFDIAGNNAEGQVFLRHLCGFNSEKCNQVLDGNVYGTAFVENTQPQA